MGLIPWLSVVALLLARKGDADETETAAPSRGTALAKHRASPPAKRGATRAPAKHGAALSASRAPVPSAIDAQRKAAREFVGYVQSGGRNHPRIADYQRRMGKLKADGVIGPKTRARAEDLLNMTIAWPADVAPKTPDPIADILHPESAKRAPKPAQHGALERPRPIVNVQADRSNVETPQHAAARHLYEYVLAAYRSGNAALVGSRAKPSSVVRKDQAAMSQLVADGIYGPKTQARGKAILGKDFPPTPAQLAAFTASQARAPAPTRKPRARKPAPRAAAPETQAHKAASGLVTYVQRGGRNRSDVAVFQRGMGGLDPDGIVGALTKARVKAILGTRPDWPSQLTPQGDAPSPSDPREAAAELRAYLDTYSGKHADRIAAYQRTMGGLKADGVAGPKTRARMRELGS